MLPGMNDGCRGEASASLPCIAHCSHLHVAGMHIDLAARTVEIDGTLVCLSPIEFELLVAFAGDPMRVFNRDKLSRCIW